MISDKNIYNAIARYLSGECSEEEGKKIKTWIKEDPERELIFSEITELWQKNPIKQSQRDVRTEWEKLSDKMALADQQAHEQTGSVVSENIFSKKRLRPALHNLKYKIPRRPAGFRYWSVRVAAAILLVGFVTLVVSLIVPNLENNNMAFAMREVVTDAGQRVNIQLEDGTKVQLNSRSKLTTPGEFQGDSRIVSLTGEAYFKVVADDRPFIITIDDKQIEILGTEFNVSAYENEPFKVVVSDGVVAVHDPDLDQEDRTILGKRDMHLNTNGKVELFSNIDIDNHLAWMDHRLVFDDTPLAVAARTLERWYRVEVALENPELENLRVSASFKNEPAYEVIRILSYSLNLDYQIEDRRVLFLEKKQAEYQN